MVCYTQPSEKSSLETVWNMLGRSPTKNPMMQSDVQALKGARATLVLIIICDIHIIVILTLLHCGLPPLPGYLFSANSYSYKLQSVV